MPLTGFDLSRARQIEQGLSRSGTYAGALFGWALATGDFDGDGYLDLAIGVPMQDQPGVTEAGGVTALYGALFANGFEIGGAGGWLEP